jgi:hypothetical protein
MPVIVNSTLKSNEVVMIKHSLFKVGIITVALSSLLMSQTSFADERHHRQKSYSHGHQQNHHKVKHYSHHERWQHGRHYRPYVIHHDHHNGAAIIGGAILGAVIINAIDNDRDYDRDRNVTVIKQTMPAQTMIYRQLADGSCYRVSYDANGTEYLQKIDNSFCGSVQ